MHDSLVRFNFGKDYYSRQGEMIQWCRENLGEGGWGFNDSLLLSDKLWQVESMFGNTTFTLKPGPGVTMFALKWQNQR